MRTDSPEHSEGPLPIPRQLPGDVRGFVNRSTELRRLNAVLTGDSDEPRVVSIHVITGMAGVGKTSLALHWAHQVWESFPGGQLYTNLRGYDPGFPVTPLEALNGFLMALQMPAGAIPTDVESAAALYRSLLAGRQMLVILDNAATVEQVRPLLPGTAGCLVLVTSRSQLSGLAVRDGARRLTLRTLPEPEAVTLLRTVTAAYREGDDSDKLVELAGLCARLPLALRIAAERAASHPFMRLDDLIEDLRDESALWKALSLESDGEAEAVRTVFAWSYRALPADAARLFRLLGLHPGPEFGSSAVAALAAVSTSKARHLLDVLVGAHLLEQRAPDRYEFHDLLRAYAADQAQQDETAGDRVAAVQRVLEWYLHSADAAQTLIHSNSLHPPLGVPVEGIRPMRFSNYQDALHWYVQERPNLLASARVAENAGFDQVAWQLPAVLRNVHATRNDFAEWLAMGQIGLQAARRLGDRVAQGELLDSLGMACRQSYRLAQGLAYFQEAVAIQRELGDREKEGRALNGMGLVFFECRRLDEAAACFEKALSAFREVGTGTIGEAYELLNLAEVNYELGRLDEAEIGASQALTMHQQSQELTGQWDSLRLLSAVQRERGELHEALRSAQSVVDAAVDHRDCMWEGWLLLELGKAQQANSQLPNALMSYQRASVVQRQLGDRRREALAWNGAGEVYRQLGRFEEAAHFHQMAAAAHRELDDSWHLAVALDGLADALHHAGEEEAAQRHWAEALQLLATFNDPRATAMRARISSEAPEPT